MALEGRKGGTVLCLCGMAEVGCGCSGMCRRQRIPRIMMLSKFAMWDLPSAYLWYVCQLWVCVCEA